MYVTGCHILKLPEPTGHKAPREEIASPKGVNCRRKTAILSRIMALIAGGIN